MGSVLRRGGGVTKTTVIGVGSRTKTQAMKALEKGTAVRSFRAQKKWRWRRMGRAEAAGEIAAVLLDLPDEMRTMEVFDLLVACPGVGPGKARTWLARMNLASNTRLEGLSEARRLELIRRLAP